MSSGQYTPGNSGQQDPAGSGQQYDTAAPVDYGNGEVVPSAPDHEPATPVDAGTTAPADSSTASREPAEPTKPGVTRAGMVWVAVVASLVILTLLIIFILQNQDQVVVSYFGLAGNLPLGMALFIASVAGGALVAAAGGVRILQLRATAHRARSKQKR